MADDSFPNTIHSTIIDYTDNQLMASSPRAGGGGGKETYRKAQFLKPRVSSATGPPLKLPSLAPEPKWQLKVTYNGWFTPLDKWSLWVYSMHSKYSSIWKQAGIYESVMLSTYRFTRNDELILGVAERWCSDTNTFVFPWGEATITLEDLMVLGAFSVTGESVLLPLEGVEQGEVLEFFMKFENIGHKQWFDRFMGSGEFEHEAFLCLWLSRYVFPGEIRCRVSGRVFSIAIHLASGKRLALAPALLASLYRDLRLLKEAMVVSTEMSGGDYWLFVSLFSPLYYVQAWVWERLVSLRPGNASLLGLGDARMARWRARRCPTLYEVENVRRAINDNADSFLWRPYVEAVNNWPFPEFYVEKELWIKCGDGLTLEFESFARCLRSCHIAGVDFVEPYNPHRVAMQFGFDQDLPGWIGREQLSPEMAWSEYNKAFGIDEILYVRSRDAGSDVSCRYLEWWRKMVLCPVVPFPGLFKGRRSVRGRRVQFTGDDSNISMDDFHEEHIYSSHSVKLDACNEMLGQGKSSTSHNSVLLAPRPGSLPFQGQANNCAQTSTALVLSKRSNTDFPVGILSKFKVRKRNGNTFGNPLKARNKIGRRGRKVSRGRKMKLLADIGPTANLEPVTNQLVIPERSNSGAELVNRQLIKSITGAEYLHVVLSKRALRMENDVTPRNVNAVVSDIEVEVTRVQGEVAALRSTDPESRRSSSVHDIETRVSAIKVRVAAVERELAALKTSDQQRQT